MTRDTPQPPTGRDDMTTRITETEMTSSATRHTATARPVPGEPTLWSVTWLPGRALTRDQAITAMTIAETVSATANPPGSAEGRWRPHLESWAAELGLSADAAAEMASAPPAPDRNMGRAATKPAAARTNRAGSQCPPWCTADHDHVTSHMSDMTPGRRVWEIQVRIVQDGSDRHRPGRPKVDLSKIEPLIQVDFWQAEGLAGLLEELADCSTPYELRALASDVRSAAARIDPTRQPAAPATEIPADREPELE